MKTIIALFAALIVLSATATDSANILVSVQNFGQNPLQRRQVMLTPISPLVRAELTNQFTTEPISQITSTNGVTTFSNVLWGVYRMDISGSGKSYTLTLGTNSAANVSAVSLIGTTTLPPDPLNNFYSQAQIDALLASSGTASVHSAAGTNVTVVTNSATLVTISADAQTNATLANLALTGAITNVVAGSNATVQIANGVATVNSTASGGGSQTPLLADVNADSHSVTNADTVQALTIKSAGTITNSTSLLYNGSLFLPSAMWAAAGNPYGGGVHWGSQGSSLPITSGTPMATIDAFKNWGGSADNPWMLITAPNIRLENGYSGFGYGQVWLGNEDASGLVQLSYNHGVTMVQDSTVANYQGFSYPLGFNARGTGSTTNTYNALPGIIGVTAGENARSEPVSGYHMGELWFQSLVPQPVLGGYAMYGANTFNTNTVAKMHTNSWEFLGPVVLNAGIVGDGSGLTNVGGSQTPLTSDINANNFGISNLSFISTTGALSVATINVTNLVFTTNWNASLATNLNPTKLNGTSGLSPIAISGTPNISNPNLSGIYTNKTDPTGWYIYNEDLQQFEFGRPVSATSFSGSGSSLTGLNGQNITSGSISNAQIAAATINSNKLDAATRALLGGSAAAASTNYNLTYAGNLVALGDSITAGSGAPVPYTTYFQTYTKNLRSMTNMGVAGYSTFQILSNVVTPNISAISNSTWLYWGGINNAAASLADTETNILNTRALLSDPAHFVFLSTLTQTGSSPTVLTYTTNLNIWASNTFPLYLNIRGHIMSLAADANDSNDVAAGWTPRSFTLDGLHLNDKGLSNVALYISASMSNVMGAPIIASEQAVGTALASPPMIGAGTPNIGAFSTLIMGTNRSRSSVPIQFYQATNQTILDFYDMSGSASHKSSMTWNNASNPNLPPQKIVQLTAVMGNAVPGGDLAVDTTQDGTNFVQNFFFRRLGQFEIVTNGILNTAGNYLQKAPIAPSGFPGTLKLETEAFNVAGNGGGMHVVSTISGGTRSGSMRFYSGGSAAGAGTVSLWALSAGGLLATNANSDATAQMVLMQNGNMGVGSVGPDSTLQVYSTNASLFKVSGSGNTNLFNVTSNGSVTTLGSVTSTNGYYLTTPTNNITGFSAGQTILSPMGMFASLNYYTGTNNRTILDGVYTNLAAPGGALYTEIITNGFTSGTNGFLTNTIAGWYHIGIGMDTRSLTANSGDEIEGDLFVNETATEKVSVHATLGTAGSYTPTGMKFGQVYLPAGSGLSFRIKGVGTTDAVPIVHAVLSVGAP